MDYLNAVKYCNASTLIDAEDLLIDHLNIPCFKPASSLETLRKRQHMPRSGA